MSFSLSPGIGRAMKFDGRLRATGTSTTEKKIFDAVKSLLNLLKEWDEQHLAGKRVLASMMKLKDGLGWKLDNLLSGPKLDALLEACNILCAVLDGMVEVANNLHMLAQQIDVLSNLEQYQAEKSRLPVFSSGTWDCAKFGAVFQSISRAFHEEIKVLTSIKEAVARSTDKSALTVYIARWNNPGCFSNKVVMLINGLLIESSMSTV